MCLQILIQMYANMNKKMFFLSVIAVAVLGCFSANASTMKKVFFDRNLKAVDFEEFAEYYRVEMYPDNKSAPIVYRFFSKTGTLLAEGTATYLDAKDHSKCVYIGENISYYNNGNVAERFVLENPGPLSSANYYEAYNEDNRPVMKGNWSGEAFSGEMFDYEKDYVIHYYVKNGVRQGEMQIFKGDTLYMTTNFNEGKEEGKRVTYYPSGKKSGEVMIKNDLKNGIYESYDENGRVTNRIPYKNGLPIGTVILNMNDVDGAEKYTYYEMESAKDAPLFIGVFVSKKEYEDDSITRLKTRSGNKISEHRDHFNILRYDLFIRNLTDEPIITSIENIKVLTYDEKHTVNVDIYIDEPTAREICLRHYSHEKDAAYENASEVAKSAATTKSTSFGAQTASSSQTASSVGAAVGGGAGRFGAVGNSGYVFGGSRGGWAALGASASSASSFAYGFSVQTTKTVNGAVYYQVNELEKEKAKKYISLVRQQTRDEIERIITSQFTVPANGTIEREILASEDLEDFIVLRFTINGYKYSLTIQD